MPTVYEEEKEGKLAMLVSVLSSHHARHEEKTAGAHAWLKEKPCKGWTSLKTKGSMALGPRGSEETRQALRDDGPVLGELRLLARAACFLGQTAMPLAYKRSLKKIELGLEWAAKLGLKWVSKIHGP